MTSPQNPSPNPPPSNPPVTVEKRTSLLEDVFSEVFSDHEEGSKSVINTSIFEEVPVTFREFVEGAEHMGFPQLSPRQYSVADFMFNGDIDKIFDNGNSLGVCLWGKGSGKDSLASLMLLYCIYYMLCVRDPQRYFGMPSGEWIDCLNIAYSAHQANSVFFEKLKQRVLRWEWLKKKYTVRMSGVYLSQLKTNSTKFVNNAVILTSDGIIFPKLLRVISGNSQQESFEGKNLLLWVMDEASAFKDKTETHNAEKVYRMLRSSATSRFGTRWKGFILSFPRQKDDFTIRMYEVSKKELHMYGDKGATHEVKPRHCFRPETFEFEGWQIPIDFQEDFKLDPQDSKCKYLCEPPEVEEAFIEFPERVDEATTKDRKPIMELTTYFENNLVHKRVINFQVAMSSVQYVITIDLGLRNDAAALSVFHKEMGIGNLTRYIQDLVIDWIPDKEKGVSVSFMNVLDIILKLKERIMIYGVYFDQWNSAMLVQQLAAKGIHSAEYKLDFQDYKDFKEKLYLGCIDLLQYPMQALELKRLQTKRGNRVDHPDNGSKDLADTLVGAVKVLSSSSISKGAGALFDDGEIIPNNIPGRGFEG